MFIWKIIFLIMILLKLNLNPYLIGFNNGIFDLKSMEFRNGNFDDYVSLSTGYCYTYINNDNNNIEELLKEIIPDDNTRLYVLKLLGYCLYGNNDLQEHYIFCEYDSNSIICLIHLIKEVFGEYYGSSINVPVKNCQQFFTGPNVPNVPNVSKDNFDHKRIIVNIDEENVNKSNIYEYTKILETIIKNKQKVILLSKNMPIININKERKIWNKVKVIPFNTKDNGITHQKLINIKKNISEYRDKFINIILKYYKIYEETGLNEMDTITTNYINDFDQEFINKNIKRDKTGKIKWVELKDKIQEYYKSKKIPIPDSSEDIKNIFIEKLFKNKNYSSVKVNNQTPSFKGWHGYSLI